ncbi:hypothetical protein ACFYZH_10100 [Streptomyces abikoensis]|uniref:hypothetical protein n=1 Tax=Streptomyces abikoensis TaxID=97398 RepID=UPI0036C0528F
MARPHTIPEGRELFLALARGDFKNQKEIAEHYGVKESSVSEKLSPFKEPPIRYRALLPWSVLDKDWRNPRPARSLRLHLKSRMADHTLTSEEEATHSEWIDGLKRKTLTYSQEDGWKYVERKPEHEDFVAVLPQNNDLAPETIELYRIMKDR